MGLRESLNRNPLFAGLVTLLIILVAAWFTYDQYSSRHDGERAKAYYTTDDDGFSLDNLFVDSIDRFPPFIHKGMEAYLAHVYTCDGGKHRFIGYIEKYDDASKEKLESAPKNASGHVSDSSALEYSTGYGIVRLAKKKGTEWVSSIFPDQFQKLVQDVQCDSEGDGQLQEVFPK